MLTRLSPFFRISKRKCRPEADPLKNFWKKRGSPPHCPTLVPGQRASATRIYCLINLVYDFIYYPYLLQSFGKFRKSNTANYLWMRIDIDPDSYRDGTSQRVSEKNQAVWRRRRSSWFLASDFVAGAWEGEARAFFVTFFGGQKK